MALTNSQKTFITSIKEKIRQAQYEALKNVNIHLIKLYWEIGMDISEKQSENWGKSIVEVLSKELQKEFPGISGFSERNLWLMAQFYNEYHDVEFLQPLVAEISWSKHIIIMAKCKDNLMTKNILLIFCYIIENCNALLQLNLKLANTSLSILESQPILNWTHIQRIMRVSDPQARAWYLNEAAEQSWDVRTLDRNISTFLGIVVIS